MVLCRTLSAALLLSLAAYSQAQSNAGDVKGTVLDQSGAPISGAKLVLSDDSRGIQRNAVSDGEGLFYFQAVNPGKFRLRTEHSGFTPKLVEGIEVRVGDTLNLTV